MIRAAMFAAALAVTAMPAAAAGPHAKAPVIIGYLPFFRDYSAALDATDLSKVTHINLAFVNPDAGGAFVSGDTLTCSPNFYGGMTPVADLEAVVARAHAAHVKVLPSLGGGQLPPCAGDWVKLLAPDMQAQTVANLLKMVDEYDLDGLDIDLEWEVLTAIDQAGQFTPFVQALSAELRKRHKLLTCATASNPGGMVPVESVPLFDYINIMSYDGVGTSPQGVIYGPPGGEHADMDLARHDIAVWQARGATKAQIVLGVPFYGKPFGAYAGGPHNYKDLVAAHGGLTAESDILGHACGGCDYVTYNGRPTIRAKAELARRSGAGVMIWELTGDAPAPDSLLDALYDSLNAPEE